MKRVLITGGAGFIGHHVVDYLLEKTDYDIVILDRLDMSGNLQRLVEIPTWNTNKGRVKFIWHDLKALISGTVASQIGDVDYILHLAASTHVDRSLTNPLEFDYDNYIGTANLLEFIRTSPTCDNLKLFVNFSTDEVYGPAPDGVSHKEGDPHNPTNPYAASKSGACKRVMAAYHSFHTTVKNGMPVVNTYTMNNIGERQHPEKFLPKLIKKIANGEEMPIYADVDKDGKVVQDKIGSRVWMHARNTASALLFLMEHAVPGEEYNIIGFDEYDLITLANKVAEVIGKPLVPKYVGFYGARPGHDRRYSLDGTKMSEMGWKPELSFDESIKRIVDFTLKNPQWQ